LISVIRFYNQKKGVPFRKINVTLTMMASSKVKLIRSVNRSLKTYNSCIKHFFQKCLVFEIFYRSETFYSLCISLGWSLEKNPYYRCIMLVSLSRRYKWMSSIHFQRLRIEIDFCLLLIASPNG